MSWSLHLGLVWVALGAGLPMLPPARRRLALIALGAAGPVVLGLVWLMQGLFWAAVMAAGFAAMVAGPVAQIWPRRAPASEAEVAPPVRADRLMPPPIGQRAEAAPEPQSRDLWRDLRAATSRGTVHLRSLAARGAHLIGAMVAGSGPTMTLLRLRAQGLRAGIAPALQSARASVTAAMTRPDAAPDLPASPARKMPGVIRPEAAPSLPPAFLEAIADSEPRPADARRSGLAPSRLPMPAGLAAAMARLPSVTVADAPGLRARRAETAPSDAAARPPLRA